MAASTLNVYNWLAVRQESSDIGLFRAVENRLPLASVDRLLKLGFTRDETDRNVIAARTLQHRKSRNEKLSVAESDRALRVLRLLSQTEHVYGTRQNALAWLRTSNARLDDRKPIDLISTDAGVCAVETILIQIDEGMFV